MTFVALRLYGAGAQMHRRVYWRRAQHAYRVFRRDGRRRSIQPLRGHQVVRRRPVAVAVQQRTDDPAVERALEGLVVRLRLPLGDQFAVLAHETADVQPLRVRYTAPIADAVRRVGLLQALVHAHKVRQAARDSCYRSRIAHSRAVWRPLVRQPSEYATTRIPSGSSLGSSPA